MHRKQFSVAISKVLKNSVQHFQKVTLKRGKSQSQNCGMNSVSNRRKRSNWHLKGKKQEQESILFWKFT